MLWIFSLNIHFLASDVSNMIKTNDALWSMNALCVCSLVQNHVSLRHIDYGSDSIYQHIAHSYFSAPI